jgi:hypothetical protein
MNAHPVSRFASARRWLLPCLLALPISVSAAERWRVTIPATGNERLTGYAVAALPDGGFLFSQSENNSALRWLSRFDGDGRLAEGPVRANRLLGATVVRVDGSLADFVGFDDTVSGNFPALGCDYAGPLLGRELTRYPSSYQLYANSRYQLPPLPVRDLVEFSLPGASGARQLAVMDAYCSRRTLLQVPRNSGRTLLADDGQSVIVIERDTATLRRLDAGGERWSLAAGGSSLRLYGQASNGDLLLATSEGPLRVGQDGALRWRRPLSEFNLPIMHIGDDGFGVHVVESVTAPPTQRPYRQRISVLDDDGAIRARQELSAQQMLVAAIPSLARAGLWQAEAATPPGTEVAARRPSSLVTITPQAGLSTVATFSADQHPRFELATGRIVEFDRNEHVDYLRQPGSGERQRLESPAVPATQAVLDLVALADGALLAARTGPRKLDVVRVDAAGALRWTRSLGGGDADPLLSPGQAQVVVAANSTRACVWRTGIAEPLMQCLDVASGEDVLPSFRFPLYLRGERPQLRLDAKGGMQVVGVECVPSSQPTGAVCLSQTLIRARLAPDGAVLGKESFVGALAPWLWGEDGQLAHPEIDPASGDLMALVRDDAGAVIARYRIDDREQLLAQAPGGRLLSAQPINAGEFLLRQRAPDGTLEWGQTLATEGSFSRSSKAAHWLADGDWLLLRQLSIAGVETPLVIERRRGADGQRRWQTRLPGDRLRGPAIMRPDDALLDARNNRLWLGAPVRQGGRLTALDLGSGEPVQADLLAPDPAADGPLISDARSVLAADGLIVAWTRQRDQALQLARVAAEAPAEVGQDAAGGVWHAADTDGQGLLLESFEAGDTLGGAWFTFSRLGGSADSELRWFALQGTRDGAGEYALDILASRGGRFAEPPAVPASAVGEARLRVHDCHRATLTYRFTDGELAGLAGAVPLQRTAHEPAACAATDADHVSTSITGSYFDLQADGQGLLLRRVGEGPDGSLVGAWFTFDPPGAADDPDSQHWFTALGPAVADLGPAGEQTLALYRSFGAAFDVGRTPNVQPVGQLQLRAEGCGLRVRWRFDDSLAAGAFAAMAGERILQRIGGCSTR